jgi:CRISPR-associated exonuclease Cas4
MENYIAISKLNDFSYNPKSLYYSSCYSQFEELTYKDTPQYAGKIAHEQIQSQFASKSLFLDKFVISQELMIFGKIDIYDVKKKLLVERKKKIKKIFIGHLMQVYAQYFCMIEMGYEIDQIIIYSIDDNKKYKIDLPTIETFNLLSTISESIRNYNFKDLLLIKDKDNKDFNTIYNNLYF